MDGDWFLYINPLSLFKVSNLGLFKKEPEGSQAVLVSQRIAAPTPARNMQHVTSW